MEASAPGYENNSVSKTFTVLPIRNISSNNDNTVSSDLHNINNNPSNANSRPVITTLLPKTYNNLNSPLIFSKQNPPRLALQSRVYIPSANSLSYENGRVYIPSANSLSYENSRVYIPSSGHTSNNNNNNNNNMMSTYNKVGIPSPNTNSTIEQAVNPIQKPFEQVCQSYSKTLRTSCQSYSKTLRTSCQSYSKTLRTSCQSYSKTLRTSCQSYSKTPTTK